MRRSPVPLRRKSPLDDARQGLNKCRALLPRKRVRQSAPPLLAVSRRFPVRRSRSNASLAGRRVERVRISSGLPLERRKPPVAECASAPAGECAPPRSRRYAKNGICFTACNKTHFLRRGRPRSSAFLPLRGSTNQSCHRTRTREVRAPRLDSVRRRRDRSAEDGIGRYRKLRRERL